VGSGSLACAHATGLPGDFVVLSPYAPHTPSPAPRAGLAKDGVGHGHSIPTPKRHVGANLRHIASGRHRSNGRKKSYSFGGTRAPRPASGAARSLGAPRTQTRQSVTCRCGADAAAALIGEALGRWPTSTQSARVPRSRASPCGSGDRTVVAVSRYTWHRRSGADSRRPPRGNVPPKHYVRFHPFDRYPRPAVERNLLPRLGLRRVQVQPGDPPGHRRSDGDVGHRAADRQHSGLGRCGGDCGGRRPPACSPEDRGIDEIGCGVVDAMLLACFPHTVRTR